MLNSSWSTPLRATTVDTDTAFSMTARQKQVFQLHHELFFRRRSSRCGAQSWEGLSGGLVGEADSWLIAHDLYHHLPGDSTLADELATVGAEYYVCYEDTGTSDGSELPPPGKNALEGAAAGIVGMCFDSDTTHLSFRLAKARGKLEVPETAAAIFNDSEVSAVAQLREMLEGNDDKPWLRSLERFSRPGVASSWVARGYLNARKRFPDQLRVRENWHEAQRRINALAPSAPLGSVLRATRTGYELHLQLQAPAGDTFSRLCRQTRTGWQRACPQTGRWYEVEHDTALAWWLARGWTRVADAPTETKLEEQEA